MRVESTSLSCQPLNPTVSQPPFLEVVLLIGMRQMNVVIFASLRQKTPDMPPIHIGT